MKTQEELRRRREEAIDDLTEAFADDTIEMAEFERRLAEAQRAENPESLDSVMTGIKRRSIGPDMTTAVAVVPKTAPPGSVAKSKLVLSLFGSNERRGVWKVPEHLVTRSIFGSTVLDLREAIFAAGVTEIVVGAVFGSIEIIVPPQLAVEIDGIAIFGSFENVERSPVTPDPSVPLVRVRGSAVFGTVEVETRLPPSLEKKKK
jgi:hypothetical protein